MALQALTALHCSSPTVPRGANGGPGSLSRPTNGVRGDLSLPKRLCPVLRPEASLLLTPCIKASLLDNTYYLGAVLLPIITVTGLRDEGKG